MLHAAEVLPLPERVVAFVCRQGGELLLWDFEAAEMVGLSAAAHPCWLGELAPNTPVLARFYQGRPVCLSVNAGQRTTPDPAHDTNA